MTFDAAVIEEQGVTFAVVIVESSAVKDLISTLQTQHHFSTIFPDMPIILLTLASGGVPLYYGSTDIVKSLVKTPLSGIPFQQYTV